MATFLNSLMMFLPEIEAWGQTYEQQVLSTGRRLTHLEIVDAKRVGVLQPEKIRVTVSGVMPLPEIEALRFIGEQVGLVRDQWRGISIGYAITLREGAGENRQTLVHECVHVSQYERLGISQFLRDYLRECVAPGYPFGSLEQEAKVRSHLVCQEG